MYRFVFLPANQFFSPPSINFHQSPDQEMRILESYSVRQLLPFTLKILSSSEAIAAPPPSTRSASAAAAVQARPRTTAGTAVSADSQIAAQPSAHPTVRERQCTRSSGAGGEAVRRGEGEGEAARRRSRRGGGGGRGRGRLRGGAGGEAAWRREAAQEGRRRGRRRDGAEGRQRGECGFRRERDRGRRGKQMEGITFSTF
jgi:hypothetical protein